MAKRQVVCYLFRGIKVELLLSPNPYPERLGAYGNQKQQRPTAAADSGPQTVLKLAWAHNPFRDRWASEVGIQSPLESRLCVQWLQSSIC